MLAEPKKVDDARSSPYPSVIALGYLYEKIRGAKDRVTGSRAIYRPKTTCVYMRRVEDNKTRSKASLHLCSARLHTKEGTGDKTTKLD